MVQKSCVARSAASCGCRQYWAEWAVAGSKYLIQWHKKTARALPRVHGHCRQTLDNTVSPVGDSLRKRANSAVYLPFQPAFCGIRQAF
ncbi:MAG: hypothetical protein Q8O50_06590, partial [Hydrogenophaga sp.]|nr:hypothetical protein [Hydrogenophaga sp.]